MGLYDVTSTEAEWQTPYAPTVPGIADIIQRTDWANQNANFTNFQVDGQNLSDRFGSMGGNLTAPMMPGGGGLDFDLVNRVADNPYMTGMIDASLRDSTRQLTENYLPGLAAYGAGTNNLGSTKKTDWTMRGMRDYEDRAADVGSQMRGQAYSQGLGVAERNLDRGLDMLPQAFDMHRIEEMKPYLKPQISSDILLPIAEAFKSREGRSTAHGDLESVLLDQVLFGGGSGEGIVGSILGKLGLGGGPSSGDDRLDLAGETISSNDGGNLISGGTNTGGQNALLGGAATNPLLNTVGGVNQTAPATTVGQQPVIDPATQPQGGTADRGQLPASILDPILGSGTGQTGPTEQLGDITQGGDGSFNQDKDYGDLEYRTDPMTGERIPQRAVTPGLVDEAVRQMPNNNPNLQMSDAEHREFVKQGLENNGGVLPSDEYAPPSSEQEFKDLATQGGITLTEEQLQAARDANPQWASDASPSDDTGQGSGGSTQPGPDLVSPGFHEGNIVDGGYFDPTQNIPMDGYPNIGGPLDLGSLIPGVGNIIDAGRDIVGNVGDTIQEGIGNVTDPIREGVDNITGPAREALENLPGNINFNFPDLLREVLGGRTPDYGAKGPLSGADLGPLQAPLGNEGPLSEVIVNEGAGYGQTDYGDNPSDIVTPPTEEAVNEMMQQDGKDFVEDPAVAEHLEGILGEGFTLGDLTAFAGMAGGSAIAAASASGNMNYNNPLGGWMSSGGFSGGRRGVTTVEGYGGGT